MNITFFIGNGFDLNLGLQTTYNDFVKIYIDIGTNNKVVSYFKSIISKDFNYWCNAEEAIGKITKQFKEDGFNAEDFSICHEDFCNNLSEYLTLQENQINYKTNKEKISKTLAETFDQFIKNFRTTERNNITTDMNAFNPQRKYQFINFNYTNTLQKCINTLKESNTLSVYASNITRLINVHGTLKEDMVFGVHDISQIAEPTLFEGYGYEYISQIIKNQTDEFNRQNTYSNAIDIINGSQLIYIYGMSNGITDTFWWKKICSWLKSNERYHLILHRYNAPKRNIIARKYLTYERESREHFLQYCNYDQTTKDGLMNRIHIDDSNIFEGLNNIAEPIKVKGNKELVLSNTSL